MQQDNFYNQDNFDTDENAILGLQKFFLTACSDTSCEKIPNQ